MFLPRLKQFMAEPLLQFLLIGIAIFIIDSVATSYRQDDRKILIDDARLDELIEIFTEGQGRKPSNQEIDNLIVKWTQNEIMYREAKRMGLDQGDEMIRSRLILKMQNILFNSLSIDMASEDELKAWFEEYRVNYLIPAAYTIEQFYFAPDTPENRKKASRLKDRLSSGDLSPLQDFTVRRYLNRPESSLSGMFITEDIASLLQAPLNQWLVVSSDKGLHLAQVLAVDAARQQKFDDIKRQVAKDWKQYSADYQLMQKTTELAKQYKVEITSRLNESPDSQSSEASSGQTEK